MAFERSAVIAYRVDHQSVRILNIFYGGRDVDGFYLGDYLGDTADVPQGPRR